MATNTRPLQVKPTNHLKWSNKTCQTKHHVSVGLQITFLTVLEGSALHKVDIADLSNFKAVTNEYRVLFVISAYLSNRYSTAAGIENSRRSTCSHFTRKIKTFLPFDTMILNFFPWVNIYIYIIKKYSYDC